MADALQLKHELKTWERNFREQNGGRAPTKEDTKKDPVIAAKYKLYRTLPKQSSATSSAAVDPMSNQGSARSSLSYRGTGESQSTSRMGYSTLSAITKSRPVESPVKAATSNPFSPTKPKQRLGPLSGVRGRASSSDDEERDLNTSGNLNLNSADVNPFLVSPSKATVRQSSLFSDERKRNLPNNNSRRTARQSSRSTSPSPLPPILRTTKLSSQPTSPADQKQRFDSVSSPQKLHHPVALSSSAAKSFPNGPANSYTPRTKARKRMRGEEVPYTPSEGRRNKKPRAASQNEGDDFEDAPTKPFGVPAFSARPGSDLEIDELPESPVKPRRAPDGKQTSGQIFRPIFDEEPTTVRPAPAAMFHLDRPEDFRPLADNLLDQAARSISGSAEGQEIEAGPEYTLHPPSPPAHSKQWAGPSHPKLARKNNKSGLPVRDADEPEGDLTSSAEEEVVLSRNLAWGSRPQGAAHDSSDSMDDDLLAPWSASPLASSTGSISIPEDLNLSGNLRQALTISSTPIDADNVVREPRESIAWRAFVQGHQDPSIYRVAGGIWDVGEVDEAEGEDWESEPDGWNGSQDS